MVEGGMKCIKYLLFAFNLIFFITGVALITVGVLVKTKLKEYEQLFGDKDYTSSALLLIIVGVVIFLIAFFGCCGAVKESFCMVMTFAVLLGLIFVLELAAGIAGYLLRDDIEKVLSDQLLEDMQKYNTGNDTSGLTKVWDTVQHDLKCCGVNNSNDWKQHNSYFKNLTTAMFPDSCCQTFEAKCAAGKDVKAWNVGCSDKLKELLTENALAVGGVGIGIAFIQLVGMVLACCLARAIKEEYEVV